MLDVDEIIFQLIAQGCPPERAALLPGSIEKWKNLGLLYRRNLDHSDYEVLDSDTVLIQDTTHVPWVFIWDHYDDSDGRWMWDNYNSHVHGHDLLPGTNLREEGKMDLRDMVLENLDYYDVALELAMIGAPPEAVEAWEEHIAQHCDFMNSLTMNEPDVFTIESPTRVSDDIDCVHVFRDGEWLVFDKRDPEVVENEFGIDRLEK